MEVNKVEESDHFFFRASKHFLFVAGTVSSSNSKGTRETAVIERRIYGMVNKGDFVAQSVEGIVAGLHMIRWSRWGVQSPD